MKRTSFVLVAVMALVLPILAQCVPAAPLPVSTPQVVEKIVTQVVEKPVQVTVMPAKKYTIGVTMNSAQHPYITAMLDSIRTECQSLNLDCIELDARFDAAVQAKQIEDLIARKVDGILLFPVDVAAIKPLLKKIKDAGIPVVSYGNRVLDEDLPMVNAVTGEDSYYEGQQVARMVGKDFGDKPATIVVIEGLAGGWVATQRSKGFVDELPRVAPNVKILAQQPADWNRAKALKIMEDYLTRYPDVNAVYAHDDDMAMGALEAIKAAGKLGTIKVYGIGGMREFIDVLKKGEVNGTVQQSPVDFGTLPVRTIYDILMGRNVPPFRYVDMPQITSENVATFKPEW